MLIGQGYVTDAVYITTRLVAAAKSFQSYTRSNNDAGCFDPKVFCQLQSKRCNYCYVCCSETILLFIYMEHSMSLYQIKVSCCTHTCNENADACIVMCF